MDKWVIASTRESAGKSTIIVGLGKALGKRLGYMKPFGDRLLYRKKRLWDYDSALITNIFGLADMPEDLTVGFDHAKLHYMYDEKSMKEKLLEALSNIETDKDLLLIEGGSGLSYGSSVYLDCITLAHDLEAMLVFVVSGDEGEILDDLYFIKEHFSQQEIDFRGVILNKIQDVQEFESAYMPEIRKMELPVLGMIPHRNELTNLQVAHIAESLFAKVIAGEGALERVVENIFIGAMSANAALEHPLFSKVRKLIITSGDRSDLILAALESDTSCIVLTNNVLPPALVISKADEHNIPLLVVPYDTYETAKRVEHIEALLTKDDYDKIELLERLVKEHLDLEKFSAA